MRQIREVIRLRNEFQWPCTKIATSVGIGETTAKQYLFRAKQAGISWPLPENLDDAALEALLFPKKDYSSSPPLPDFPAIHTELMKKGVTLDLLWQEYKSVHPNGVCYSRLCYLYKEWGGTEPWMLQRHKAGEECFVDYAGLTIPIFNEANGTAFDSQIFVSVLGASSYTFSEATRSQALECWISSHCHMFEYFGGVSEILIPDNLKSGVTKAHLYEPECNRTYAEMAQYYGTVILPTRVCHPKDKSKVEGGVLIVEREILAPLRNYKFFSLQELNKEIRIRLDNLNKRPFQKIKGSRESLFLEIEKPALKPLPPNPYELSYWSVIRVPGSYHITVEEVPYSVPFRLVNEKVECRYNGKIVEFFYKGKQVAIHQRSWEKEKPITNPNHCPLNHQHQAERTAENLKEIAQHIGPNVLSWVTNALEDETRHLRQRIKTCLGVVRLVKSYSASRLDLACQRALYYKNLTFKSIAEMLEKNLDQMALPRETVNVLPQDHDNIRGPNYFE